MKMKVKHPIIVIEGPDGTGKTTLAKALGGHYIHCGYDKSLAGNMVDFHEHVFAAAVHLSQYSSVVIDRWRMSEVVYGSVYRSGPESPELTKKFYQMVDDSGGMFVNCMPADKDQYLDHFTGLLKTRPEMFESMNEVYDEYERAIKDLETVCVPVIYDLFNKTQSFEDKCYRIKSLSQAQLSSAQLRKS